MGVGPGVVRFGKDSDVATSTFVGAGVKDAPTPKRPESPHDFVRRRKREIRELERTGEKK